ncbi:MULTISPECIES: peptide MFS transporter [unclassified Saccharibacter]|uniref:peptide MFS transporter n=1 Tax=unclassified Saccharibacter TaxID=2648722 RepID=UPI001EF1146A|nr:MULTISPECIES: oligopeptide:H+ symporter [unclassified Saccharibacter]
MSEPYPLPLRPARRRAFSVVLAIELWERFGYYGMQAVLTIFMVQHLRMSDTHVNLMQGALGLLMYSLPVLGGVVGDQWLGTRPTLVSGAIGLTLGYGLLAVSLQHPALFLPALTLIALASGLFKPNAGALVKQIYAGDGTALDAAFTLYYMAVNVGSTISMLLVPWLQQFYGSAVAFGLCSLGLLIGLTYYALCSRWIGRFFTLRKQSLPSLAAEISRPAPTKRALVAGALGFLALWAGSVWLMASPSVIRFCVIILSVALILLWGWLYKQVQPHEKAGLFLSYVLSVETMAYLVFYQQQQSSLTLFALRAVSGTYTLGSWPIFTMSAGQFQALNPLWVMALSPILAWLYQRSARTGRDVSFPVKIILGYVCVGIACCVLWWAASTAQAQVSPWVMVFAYGAMSLGELLTMGLGLAIIARYAPARISALLMGALYLLWGVGMYGGGLVANIAALPEGAEQHVIRATFYAPLFAKLSFGAGIMCLVLVGIFPFVKRLESYHEKNFKCCK